jgi:glucosamine-6-phosphate deaminase
VEVVIVESADEIGRLGADIIERLVHCKPEPVLGLATGSSPLPVYRELIARHQAGGLSLAGARAFLLDEYVGLSADHPARYRAFIEAHLADGTDLGVDVQLLGIGGDGHIGFNEPGSSLGSRTRPKTLTAQTRRDNARFFAAGEAVPTHVLTQGIGTIADARHIVLLAAGEAKAVPLARAVEGPITAMVPGSALQLHPHVTVLVDAAAACHLELADYYRATYAGKPAWQTL